jgi:hypothetical protein
MSLAKYRKVSKGYSKPKENPNASKKEEGNSVPKKD